MKHRCPVCHKTVKTSIQEPSKQAKLFPFCSKRCKLIDLGAWLDAKYKIVSRAHLQELQEPGEPSDTSSDALSDKQ